MGYDDDLGMPQTSHTLSVKQASPKNFPNLASLHSMGRDTTPAHTGYPVDARETYSTSTMICIAILPPTQLANPTTRNTYIRSREYLRE
jgi:hypothetical protein